MNSHIKQFIEIFKKLEINLSFVDALAQMPRHDKYLKDTLANKKKLNKVQQTFLNEDVQKSCIRNSHRSKRT